MLRKNPEPTDSIQPGLLRAKDLAKYLCCSRAYVYSLIKKYPSFPSRVNLGPGCVGWLKADIDEWLRTQNKQLEVAS